MDVSQDSAKEEAGNQARTDSTNVIMPKEESLDKKRPLESTPSKLYLVSVHRIASTATITSISTEPYNDSEYTQLKGRETQEKLWTTIRQITFPFILAGIGTIGAGLALCVVKDLEVFRKVSTLLILVPPLLGLKGNLDMCLASRLSTQANLDNMSSWHEVMSMVIGNVAVVQVQATVVSLQATVFAVIMNLIIHENFEMHHAVLLAATSITTANNSCLILNLVTIAVVVTSYKAKWNPDNLATPVVASIGDVVSITLLANIASCFYDILDSDFWVLIFVIVVHLLLFLPFWVFIVLRNEYTRPVLKSGWAPALSGLFISSMGSLVLDTVKDDYKSYPLFQLIVNGIGGNLVTIQASRISTMLHQTSLPGIIPPNTAVCTSPFAALIKGMPHAATARLLICMNIVGQTVFVFAADYIFNGKSTITPAFATSYLFVTVLQVMILLYIAHVVIHMMWKWKIDPDNLSIPVLTALGDLIGSSMLALAFFFLDEIGLPYGK